VLSDVRVLAVDQKTDSKNGEPILGRSVTFEVSIKQAEILALAAEMGKLSLSLRSLASVNGQDDDADRAVNSGDAASGNSKPNNHSFTLDSDASRLLLGGGKTGGERVTLLRGTSAASNKAAAQ
jgi:pilus assembly protein CpaB